MEVPHFSHSVLDVTFVRVAYILRQIAEEHELGIGCSQLGDVFDLYPLAFDRWRGILLFDDWKKHIVDVGSGDSAAAGLVDGACCFENLEDTLLVDDRSEDNRHIVEWCDSLFD